MFKVLRIARRATVLATTCLTVTAVLNGMVGYALFSRAADSAVSRVDAVVVLGGEHDGREEYGIALAQQVHASAVMLSDPYPSGDVVMQRMCSRRLDAIDVICSRPDPSTTRGEAIMTRRSAARRHWSSILLVTWRYHMPRARLLFDKCLADMGVSVSAKAVPRQYVLPIWYWQYLYAYQFAGIVKAVAAEHC
jgi:uncharacterized SAM-binding protein YcdF (DUF218 family)